MEKMIVDTEGNKLIDPSGHPAFSYTKHGEVHSFLEPETRARLEKFLLAFEDFRSQRDDRILDSNLYPSLPYVDQDLKTWKNRQRDLEFLQKNHPITGKRVLEIGSWNGWLANRLTLGGATVCAVDYFVDLFDGLGAIAHYPDSEWTAIQMDCEDLSVLEPGFDLIVFNWNLMMFSNPWKVLEQAKGLLGKNGVIVILGIIVLRNGSKSENHFKQLSTQFEKDYGIPFGLRPFKGFFGFSELQKLRQNGFETSAYQGLLTKMKGLLKPTSSQPYRAVYRRNQ
jgi:SAM-dependent methyltransferase